MVVQVLGDPEVARGAGHLGSPWYLKRTKQEMKEEGNLLSDQDGLSCLGKWDREFSKLFYIRLSDLGPAKPKQIKPECPVKFECQVK